MGNEIFEEIKKRYKKSNKYMLCVTFFVYLIALILDILRRKYVEPIIMKSKLYLHIERKINEFYMNVWD